MEKMTVEMQSLRDPILLGRKHLAPGETWEIYMENPE
jgi:hypothetical protein